MHPSTPSFRKLSAAIDFIASAIESGRHDVVADACLKGNEAPLAPDLPPQREFLLRAIGLLADRHRARSLRSLYALRRFPWFRSRLKLGGHDRELGHLHVDFVRMDSGWQLENIWLCR